MAKKFAKLDYGLDPEEPAKDDRSKSDDATNKVVGKEGQDGIVAKETTFVATYLDLIDQCMNMRYIFQLLTVVFVFNLEYVMFTQEERSMDPLITVGCTFVTCLIEMVAIMRTRFKNKEAELLDWDYIYGILFPLIIASLNSDTYTSYISCIVVQLSYMNIWIRVAISYVIAFQFGVELGVPVVTVLSYELVNTFLPLIAIEEKKVLGVIITSLVHFVKPDNIELYILRELVISFGFAYIVAAGIYKIYTNQAEQSVRFACVLGIYAVFTGIGLVVSDKLLYPVLGSSPLYWIKEYVSNDESKLSVFKFWLSLSASVPVIFYTLSKVDLSLSLKRKTWHLLIFVAVLQPIYYEPKLTALALGGLLGILIMVETIRYTGLPPFGKSLQSGLGEFADSKDKSTPYILSYIYLVLGVGLPLWLNGGTYRLSSYAGALTLGLGDSAASIIGSHFGTQHWTGGSAKTIEGSIAMASAVFGGIQVVQGLLPVSDALIPANAMVLAVGSALFEGSLAGNDNVWVPPLAYVLMELLQRFQ